MAEQHGEIAAKRKSARHCIQEYYGGLMRYTSKNWADVEERLKEIERKHPSLEQLKAQKQELMIEGAGKTGADRVDIMEQIGYYQRQIENWQPVQLPTNAWTSPQEGSRIMEEAKKNFNSLSLPDVIFEQAVKDYKDEFDFAQKLETNLTIL
jgi:hypothetical protein